MSKPNLRFVLVCLLIFVGFVSCKKDKAALETETIEIIGDRVFSVGSEQGFFNVPVSSNSKWSVELPVEATWLKATPQFGNGNQNVVFEYADNTGEQKAVMVRIATPKAHVDISIVQKSGIITPDPVVIPAVNTAAATEITSTTATLNGSYDYAKSDPAITQAGFIWKPASVSDYPEGNRITTSVNQSLSKILSGLTPETGYHFKAFVTTSAAQTYYGNQQTFTTTAAPVAQNPIVTTGTATQITHDQAVIAGNSYHYPATVPLITSSGIAYRTKGSSGNFTHVASYTYFSPFDVTLGSTIKLTPSTSYEYKAYVVTSAGTFYDVAPKELMTLSQPVVISVVTTLEATDITTSGATLKGSFTQGTQEITATGFEIRKTSGGTYTDITLPAATPFSTTLLSLETNTQYTFRAFVSTLTGKIYGSELSFKTLDNIASTNPTVTTGTALDITSTQARILGNSYYYPSSTPAVTATGVAYRIKNTIGNFITVPATGTLSPFEVTLTQLALSTTYEFKAYVITAEGTFFGESTVSEFTTLSTSTVTTNSATNITSTEATLNGSYSGQNIAWTGFGIRKYTDATYSEIAVENPSSSFSAICTALESNTKYSYYAFAKTLSGGKIIGTDISFTTLSAQSSVIWGSSAIAIKQGFRQNENSSATITIPYTNSGSGISFHNISITASGAAAAGFNNLSNQSVTIPSSSSAQISFTITGLPSTAGEVIFTINGLPGLSAPNNSVTVNVLPITSASNASAAWDFKSKITSTNWADHSPTCKVSPTLSGSMIIVENLTQHGDPQSWIPPVPENGVWGGVKFHGNTYENTESALKYVTLKLKSDSKKLSLSNIYAAMIRTGSGPSNVAVFYKLGSGEFILIADALLSSGFVNLKDIDTGSVSQLQNITPGTIITIKFVPYGASSDGSWYLSSNGTESIALKIEGTEQ